MMVSARSIAALLVATLTAFPALADYQTPEAGSETFTDILSALRPLAEDELGFPVEFAVYTMRVDGPRAFATVLPRDESGDFIEREGISVPVSVTAFLVQWEGRWQAVDWSIGGAEAWWANSPHCVLFAELISDFCPSE